MENNSYVQDMLQRTLLFFSQEEVEAVQNTVFAVSGLGGVGAITVELLARWGVKSFRLLDMDRYDPSNLNRQLFATSLTLGKPKVEVAAQRIRDINPNADVEMILAERVDNENVERFARGAGILIQNADHPSCRLFYLAGRKHKIPLVNGHATITGGRVQTFDYRCSTCESPLEDRWQKFKFGKDSKPLDRMNSNEIAEFDRQHVHPTAPSLNFVTNMVGCLIVAEAVKLLSGKGKCVLYPNYLTFDTFDYRMKIRNSRSPFNPDNLKRLWSVGRSRLSLK
ncbi:HesA/MoeB/ThiF family protein [Desulfonatronovibrio hydrogenovorans]|uniref:HesA/MoeB/ThiF family protein n=1 Tax=Desulfonatronovibrio hydrogenovorans TaxID=53245 RepID=UPI00068EE429|nr:ThiF family adenylyltransferase [Desulfonatronovibrio hydrogenovorans]